MVIIHIRVTSLPLSSWWPGQTWNVCFLLLFFWLTAHLVKILQEFCASTLPQQAWQALCQLLLFSCEGEQEYPAAAASWLPSPVKDLIYFHKVFSCCWMRDRVLYSAFFKQSSSLTSTDWMDERTICKETGMRAQTQPSFFRLLIIKSHLIHFNL